MRAHLKRNLPLGDTFRWLEHSVKLKKKGNSKCNHSLMLSIPLRVSQQHRRELLKRFSSFEWSQIQAQIQAQFKALSTAKYTSSTQ